MSHRQVLFLCSKEGRMNYKEKILELLNDEKYQIKEWSQSNKELNDCLEVEVTFKYKFPLQKSSGKEL